MSEKLGPVTFEKERKPPFLNQDIFSPKQYSEETAREIDQEVKKIIDNTHEKVIEILKCRKSVLEELAQLLLEKEIIEGDDIRRVIDKNGETSRESKREVSSQ